MMPSKGPLIAIAASLLMHVAAAAVPFSVQGPKADRTENEAVMISYVIYPKTEDSVQSKPVSKPAVSAPIKAVAVTTPKVRQIRYARPVKAIKPKPAVRNSEELLVDPQSGKVFLGYFEEIKRKIHETVKKKYSRENPGQGAVSLIFILRADGSLENTAVVSKESTAGPAVQNFAIDCIKESLPFAPFPKELELQKISFNVTILFDAVQ